MVEINQIPDPLRRQMIDRRRKVEPNLPEEDSVIDFDTEKKVKEWIGAEFMDMDGMIDSIYNKIPNASTEMIYRMELDKISKIYIIFSLIGFFMTASVLITSI